MAKRTLMSMSAYARHRGCTHQAVSKAAKAGRITLIDGQVDPEVADIQWARNTNPDQQQRGAPGQFQLTQELAAQATLGETHVPPADDDPASAESPQLVTEKTRTERLRQELMELELAAKRGEVISAADGERAYAAKLVAAREAFESLPDRVTSQMLALDYTAAHALLSQEIRSAMARLVTEAPAGVN